ncbi:MFS transporter [Streptomyces sp. NPDC019396]|uniref:MFS transporter n=1 Tax=Streptomyces sp. NPDC019396 TaxID=3154687 RepID=UPI0034011AA4
MTSPRPAPAPRTTAPERGGGSVMALLVIASCQLMVVLDITIVNIALPHIQTSLGFSTTDLSWVVSAYTLTFGGLLLLGGRTGDILGRRRVFVCGVLLFVVGSMAAGLAQSAGELLAARAFQGAGAAVASPTALALISTTFTEGPERNRAFGVFASVSAAGGALGLMAGGVIVEWLDWRWVFFVNVPIGLLIVLAAPRWIAESPRRPGTFDIAGALTATAGMVLLVYGFIRAAQDGWRDALTIASFALAIVVLALCSRVERRSRQPVIPLHLFADRNRRGTYAMMLSLAAAMFGMFFFLSLFVQNVLGFSPLKAGFAFLPVSAIIVTGARTTARLLPRFGPKPFMVTGAVLTTAGLVWLTRVDVHSTYAGSLLGPMLVFGLGMGLQFVSITVTALSGVPARESGAASGLLNTHQQVGGSLGLSLLTTVFGTAAGEEAARQAPLFLARATPDEKLRFAQSGRLPAPYADAVLTSGATTAFAVAAVFTAVAALIALFVIRIRTADIERLNGRGSGTQRG